MPNWKKLIVSGSDASLNSLIVANGITGSLFGTASQAISSSYALSASYAPSSLTASYAETASYATQFNVAQGLTASGLNYPTVDGALDQFMTTDGAGNLSFDWIKTLHQNIHNAETSSIVRGTPLYISGSTGDNANVYFADASNPLRRPATLIAYDATLAPSATGTGIISGEIQGVDTNAYPEGTIVYLAAGGGWTATRPPGSTTLVQALGVVTRQANNGRGIVFNQIGNNLPNIQSGYVWVGDADGVPQAVSTSSIQNVVSSSYATTASGVEGGGANYVTLWKTNTSLTSSLFYQDTGSNRIGLNTTVPDYTFDVNGTGRFQNDLRALTKLYLPNMQDVPQDKILAWYDVDGQVSYMSTSSLFVTSGSYAVSSSYALNATTASYALTASAATTFNISSSLYSAQGASAGVGTTTIASLLTGSYKAGFFDYVVSSGGNARAGTVMSVWDGSSVQYTDNSTLDIGSTTAVSMSVALSGANVLLQAAVSADTWDVKTTYRLI